MSAACRPRQGPATRLAAAPVHVLRRTGAAAAAALDSGLRLLVGGPGAARLRWSTDGDAPAARALLDGEIRLAIACFELGAADVERCREAGRASAAWRDVEVFGIGRVIESRLPGIERGESLVGPMHVGTHRVIAPSRIDGSQVESDREGLRWLRRRGAEFAPVAVAGDDVERAFVELRDRTHAGQVAQRLSLQGGHSSRPLVVPITRSPCPS